MPWSLTQSTPGELDQMLASYNYQSIILPSSERGYPTHIQAARDYQQTTASDGTWALLCDPRAGYRFMTGTSPDHDFQQERLLGRTETETLFKLTTFFRKNVAHGGGETREQLLRRSQLDDRLQYEEGGLIVASAGCHGAAQLFQDLARSVNIPLLNIATQTDPDTDGHFGNRTHRGLIWEWESSRTRILWHTDQIYAMAYWDPIFPIDGAGRPLGEADSDRLFFNTYWVSPRTLQDWGFAYHPHIVYPERGFGVGSRGRYEDYADFGWMGGYWRRSDRMEAHFAAGGFWDDSSRQMNGDLSQLYALENFYQLCSYDLLQYSGIRGAFDGYIRYKYEYRQRTGLAAGPHRSLDEYWDRATACANAHGGPEAVLARHRAWQESRGF